MCRYTLPLISLGVLSMIFACGEEPTAVEPEDPADRFTDPLRIDREIGPPTDFDLLLPVVPVRPGATADIHVRVYVNEALPSQDPKRTALAIPGINHTAATWGLLAEEFFAGPRPTQLCRVAAIDLPGHGESGDPVGSVRFGELVAEDYARTVDATRVDRST